MTPDRSEDVRRLFEDRFPDQRDQDWSRSHLRAVQAAAADEPTFRFEEFQSYIRELDAVSSVGAGKPVTITCAQADHEVYDALWRLCEWSPPDGGAERARAFYDHFDEILAVVRPRHNARSP